MKFEGQFLKHLDGLKAEGRYRVFADIERQAGQFPQAMQHCVSCVRPVTVWCSNDYLGMGQSPVVLQAMHEALDRCGAGSGGGTGMMTYEFKGGCGTASRIVSVSGESYTVGTFVQSNFGRRHELTVLGVPLGQHLKGGEFLEEGTGSIIAIVATDAPLLPHQLKRMARRVQMGLARTGTIGHNGSGDIFLAFSTANAKAFEPGSGERDMRYLPNGDMNPLFGAVVDTVEEAVVDAMVANADMTGIDGFTVRALPHDRLLELMRQYGRM